MATDRYHHQEKETMNDQSIMPNYHTQSEGTDTDGADEHGQEIDDTQKNSKTVEYMASAAITDAIAQLESMGESEGVDFSAMAPKKEAWDLEQRLQEKMSKLEKRTKKAIIELVRQRILATTN